MGRVGMSLQEEGESESESEVNLPSLDKPDGTT